MTRLRRETLKAQSEQAAEVRRCTSQWFAPVVLSLCVQLKRPTNERRWIAAHDCHSGQSRRIRCRPAGLLQASTDGSVECSTATANEWVADASVSACTAVTCVRTAARNPLPAVELNPRSFAVDPAHWLAGMRCSRVFTFLRRRVRSLLTSTTNIEISVPLPCAKKSVQRSHKSRLRCLPQFLRGAVRLLSVGLDHCSHCVSVQHHCRRCGRIFCADCSNHRMLLPMQ